MADGPKQRFVGRAIPLVLSAFALALAGVLVVDLYIEHRQIEASTRVAQSTISTLRAAAYLARSLQRFDDEIARFDANAQVTVVTLRETQSRFVAAMEGFEKQLGGDDQAPSRDLRDSLEALTRTGAAERVSASELHERFRTVEDSLAALTDTVERRGLDSLRRAEQLHTLEGGLEAAVLFSLAAAVGTLLFGWRAAEARARRRDAQVEEQLRRTLVDLDDFAGRVAHDLRGPLMPILAGSQWIERAPVADAVRVHAERIERSARRLTRMIDVMLQYARASAGVAPDAGTPVNATVQEVISDFEELAGSRGGRIETGLGPEVALACTPQAIQSIVANLLENALKYGVRTGAPPYVAIRTRVGGPFCIIEVEDEGPGIPRELRERVFQPLFRGQAGGAGVGLGLSIVQRLVEVHHGHVELKEGKEGGALFCIFLPLSDASRSEAARNENLTL